MQSHLNSVFNTIVQDVNAEQAECPVTLLSGPPGCGKTALIDKIRNSFASRHLDASFVFDFHQNISFVSDFFHNLRASFYSLKADSVVMNETEFNYNHFNSEFAKIASENEKIAGYYEDIFLLSSFAYQRENRKEIELRLIEAAEYIRESTPKKSIHRLLLEPNNIAVESFIVDLMNVFYPDIASGKVDGMRPSKRTKIHLSIDNCDFVNESVNKLLFRSLLFYAFQARFYDFQSYNITFSDQSIKVSDFFDFRILYSTRSAIPRKYTAKLDPELQSLIQRQELTYLSEGDIASNEKLIPNGLTASELYELSLGIQQLVLAEMNEIIASSEDIRQAISARAYNILKAFVSPAQEDLLQCLAFGYNENTAFQRKCNESFGFASDATRFLKYNLYLTKGNAEAGLKEEYKTLIRLYLKHNKPEVYEDLSNIAMAAELIPDILEKYDNEELNILVVLAYVPAENNLELARLALHKHQKDLDAFYTKHKAIFTNGKYQITPKLAERLRSYIKATDPKWHEKLSNLKAKYESRIPEERERIKTQKTAAILSYEKDIAKIDQEIASLNKSYKQLQEEMMHQENEMIDIRQQINDKSFSNSLMASSISVFITISVGIFSVILPNIFQADGPNSPVFSVQFILYTITAVLAVLDYIFIRRTLTLYKHKKQNEEFQSNLDQMEEQKQAYLNKMAEIKEEIEKYEKQKKELQDLMDA